MTSPVKGGLPWLALCLVVACQSQRRVGSNCEEADCVLGASAALETCHATCDAIVDRCASAGDDCHAECQGEIDQGGYSTCDVEFERLHACCHSDPGLECEGSGLDGCKEACPQEYVEYRACATSSGARREASSPAERIGSCVDVCGQIGRACPNDNEQAFDACIEECIEERDGCATRLAWLELAACCAGTDYAPLCEQQGLDLDIKRCRDACPDAWDACQAHEEGSVDAVEL